MQLVHVSRWNIIIVTTPSCWRNSPSTLGWIGVRGTSSSWTCVELGDAVRSVLDWDGSWRCTTTSIALINASAYGLPGYVDNTLPARCYASPWSCVCVGIFLKLPHSPTVASEPGLCIDVICTSRIQRVVGDSSHIAYQHVILWFRGIVGWSGPDRHYMTAFMRLVLPMCFAHRWLVGVCFSNFSWIECGYAQSFLKVKTTHLTKNHCGFDA